MQVFAKLAGKLPSAHGENVHSLSHARFVHVRVHRLRAVDHSVVSPLEKLQHRLLDGREWKRLLHGELLERQRPFRDYHGDGLPAVTSRLMQATRSRN